jgi:hypothetical protein
MSNIVTLPELLTIIGQALKELDKHVRQTAASPVGGGVLRYVNERWYQLEAFRALLTRWNVEPERRRHDLVIMDTEGKEQAIIEMKWFFPSLQPGYLHSDLEKLRACKCAGYMILFGQTASGPVRQQLEGLQKQIPELDADKVETFTFPTTFGSKEVEFWVAGWQIPTSRPQRHQTDDMSPVLAV